MKTSFQPNNETLIMSTDLEERLSHLRVSEITSVDPVAAVTVGDVSFEIIGWCTRENYVTIEVPVLSLHHFFGSMFPLRGTLHDHDVNIRHTVGARIKGKWHVQLFLIDV